MKISASISRRQIQGSEIVGSKMSWFQEANIDKSTSEKLHQFKQQPNAGVSWIQRLLPTQSIFSYIQPTVRIYPIKCLRCLLIWSTHKCATTFILSNAAWRVQFQVKNTILPVDCFFPGLLSSLSYQVWTHGPCFLKLEASAPSNLVPFCSVSTKKFQLLENPSPLLTLSFPAGKYQTNLCLGTILALNFSCPEHTAILFPLARSFSHISGAEVCRREAIRIICQSSCHLTFFLTWHCWPLSPGLPGHCALGLPSQVLPRIYGPL